MLPKFIIPYLQIGHGLINLSLFAMFVYQGRLGWLIRRNRQIKNQQDITKISRHRVLGPILAALMPISFVGGLILSYLDYGVWNKYPVHLATGLLLVVVVSISWLISRKIKSAGSLWRTPHFFLGMTILIIFLFQIFLGFNVLL